MILSTLTILVSTTFIFHLTQSYYKDYVRGRRYYKNSRYQHALGYFASAVEIRPRSLEAIQYLVWTYAKLDRQDGVARTLKKMSDVDPGNLSTKKWLGDTYYGLSDFPNAEQYYKELLSTEKTFIVQKKLAEVLIWQEKYEEAMPILNELIQKKPKDRKLIELLADVYSWQKEYADAAELYKRLLSKDKGAANIAFKLAEVLVWQEKYEEALPILNDLVRESPDDDKLTERLADVYSWQKEYDEAIRLYKQLLSKDKGSTDIALKLAEVLRFADRNSEAVEIYNQYLKTSE